MYKPAPLKEKNVGLWLSSFNSLYLEAILETRVYDWLALDLEHSAFSDADARDVFILCQRFGIHCFARLHGHDHLQGRKMLDLGATGIIIPVINTREELDNVCKHFFYPPEGMRGVCLSRINEFGESFDEYYKTYKPIIVPQIESRKGVENIDAILSLPYVSALFIGPYDMSADYGHPGKFDHPDIKSAIEKIKISGTKHKKGLGIHVVWPEIADLERRFTEGFSFVAYGTDVILMKSALRELKQFRSQQ